MTLEAAKKLAKLSGMSLEALAEILKTPVEELARKPRDELEKLVMAAKLHLTASKIILRTQIRLTRTNCGLSQTTTCLKIFSRAMMPSKRGGPPGSLKRIARKSRTSRLKRLAEIDVTISATLKWA